ncbi:MAG: MBL fold metallo-hydrolase [Campylobacterales bacterium]|nr:MBL fold metallo-hydrolase [Campylobacterales bacterium]
MQLLCQPMGSYQTNCYIVVSPQGELIIDPGMGAISWVKENVSNPLAILNTHGHFDHVWSNHALQTELNVPLYCPKEDAFMLQDDPFGLGITPSTPDVLVEGDAVFEIGGMKVQYWHFPGHTPGCSAIEAGGMLFTGDFVFAGSIGRVDFPFSSPEAMKKSILKFLKFQTDMPLYPGHGEASTVAREQYTLPQWVMAL